jgi:hypothetical protein
MKAAVFLASIAMFALAGLILGFLNHGVGPRMVFATVAGALGGFLISGAALNVLRRRQANSRST